MSIIDRYKLELSDIEGKLRIILGQFRGKKVCEVVSVVIMDDIGRMLLVREAKERHYNKLGIPTGKVNEGEDITAALLRELEEETGIKGKIIRKGRIHNYVSQTSHTLIRRHNFFAKSVGGEIKFDKKEILAVEWMRPEDLMKVPEENIRNPEAMKNILREMKIRGMFK